MQDTDILIPQRKVIEMTSLSASTIWREVKANRFPKSFKIGPNRVAWKHSEVLEWMDSKAGGDV